MNLDYSDFLGRIAIGRVFNGTLNRGADVGISKLDGKLLSTRITKLYTFRGLERDEAESVVAGDLVAIAGVEGIQIGESIIDLANPQPLEPLLIDEPTLAMIFTVNSSPLSGKEGSYLTSRDLRDRLQKELLTNVSIRVEDTDTPESFRVLGRGELQLAILIETMRREGFELMVGKPEIVTRTENGKKLEPLERLVIDVPENFIGIIMETIGSRRGEMLKMSNHGSGRVRMDFKIPSRGLIGLRSQLLTDTRGTALIHSIFEGWMEYGGEMALRPTGALVADRGGPSTAFALWNIQERGELFIGPAIEVYEGMIVGGNPRQPGHTLIGLSAQRADFSSNSAKYCFHTTALVCVPWPRVSSLMGSKTKRAFFIFLISRSAMPSSGGLMKSSASLIYMTCAVIV